MKGCPIRIEVWPMLVQGAVFTSQEDKPLREMIIALDSETLTKQNAVHVLWHEVVHVLMFAARLSEPHDEDEVDRLAAKLAESCPEIIDVLKINHEWRQ